MIVTLNDITERLRSILTGDMTRESASDWATSQIELEDRRELHYSPDVLEDEIWQAIIFLAGIDLLVSPGTYLFGVEDIQGWISKLSKVRQ